MEKTNGSFKPEYHPTEIAEALARLAYKEPTENTIEECTETVYTLLATAQNEYNRDCYRVFYKVLDRIAAEQDGESYDKDY